MNDKEKQARVRIWLKGYVCGAESGIKSIGSLLKNAEKREAPCPAEVQEWLIAFGEVFERDAAKMAARLLEHDFL